MKTNTLEQVPISRRALIARINRHCAKLNTVLKRVRTDSRDAHNLGDYFLVDLRRNIILDKNIDLEQWGREHGMLRPFEVLADEG